MGSALVVVGNPIDISNEDPDTLFERITANIAQDNYVTRLNISSFSDEPERSALLALFK